jgi:hypothetical protein
VRLTSGPFNFNATTRLYCRIDRVAYEIDEQLLELVAVRLDQDVRPFGQPHGQPPLQRHHSSHQIAKLYRK